MALFSSQNGRANLCRIGGVVQNCIGDWVTVEEVGSLTIRHSFRQANKVTDAIAKQGAQLAVSNLKNILVTPPASLRHIVAADKQGLPSSKLVSMLTCNKLASFGNLSVLLDPDNSQVPNSV
ncbi:hypothetical protein H5410_036050, partial [Solanum commersonii]